MDWSKPMAVTALDVAFPKNVIGRLLPTKEEIPDAFCRSSIILPKMEKEARRATPDHWINFVSEWFFSGLSSITVHPREGIDLYKALRHLSVCMVSREPKHEHKVAGVAYLCSLWFEGYGVSL